MKREIQTSRLIAFNAAGILLAGLHFAVTWWLSDRIDDPVYWEILKVLHLPAFMTMWLLPEWVSSQVGPLAMCADFLFWGYGMAWLVRWLWRTAISSHPPTGALEQTRAESQIP